MDLEYWKKVKKEKRMTMKDIAEKSGIPKGTIQNIFAGYVPTPRVDTVEAIEHALELDSPTTVPDSRIIEMMNDRGLTDNELSKLTPEDWELINSLVNRLLNKDSHR